MSAILSAIFSPLLSSTVCRSLKCSVQGAVSLDIVNPELSKEHGWAYSSVGPSGNEYAACGPERSGLNAQYLYQLYQHADPGFTGTITVPILWV